MLSNNKDDAMLCSFEISEKKTAICKVHSPNLFMCAVPMVIKLFIIHQVKRYRDKRYRANFFRFFWRDNVSTGVKKFEI